jgi:hypothetical protein
LFKYKGLRIIIETGGVTQAVDHLLCNCEALSSNPCPTKKNGITIEWDLIARQKWMLEYTRFKILNEMVASIKLKYS